MNPELKVILQASLCDDICDDLLLLFHGKRNIKGNFNVSRCVLRVCAFLGHMVNQLIMKIMENISRLINFPNDC